MQNTAKSLEGVQSSLRLEDPIKTVWATSSEPVNWSQGVKVPPTSVAFACGGTPSLLAVQVYEAFYKHHPLKLNANVIWVTIMQGLASFIASKPEAFRAKFVAFEGKKTLEVVDPQGLGPDSMNWPLAFAGFAEQIGTHIGKDKLELLTNSFSNSTPNDVMAGQVTLMDAMKSYFHYSLCGGCGIPWCELLGTVEDWRQLRAKGGALKALLPAPEHKEVFMDSWLDSLLPVLDKFVEAAEGHPDRDFFGAVCNSSRGSGMVGEPLTGWVTVFYPFDSRGRKGCYRSWMQAMDFTQKAGGATPALTRVIEAAEKVSPAPDIVFGYPLSSIPTGLAKAPVGLTNLISGQKWDMYFLAGPAEMHQDPEDGSLDVRCGWAVCEMGKASGGGGGHVPAAGGGGGT